MKQVKPGIDQRDLSSYVGHESAPTDWFKITQERINAFADSTLDHQFIHTQPKLAAKTPFGGTIAHGMLLLSLTGHFAESFAISVDGTAMALNYGFDKVRFLTPVREGSDIRAVSKIIDIQAKQEPGHYLFKYQITLEIKGEKSPALIAEWLLLLIVNP